MSYVAPELQPKFDTLSTGLKNMIMERNVQLHTLQDLIQVLGEIVKEGENDTP